MGNHAYPPRLEIQAAARPAEDDGQVIVSSDDGQISYQLKATRRGLWVQRERLRRDSHARLVQSVSFGTAEAFNRWCDADSVKFEYPLVFSELARAGRRLLDGHGR